MSKNLKEIPNFANEDEERDFWATHDSTDYVDWTQAKRVSFPNLKPTTQSISLRLPLWMLESIKITANKQDVPYQSLIKVWLNEKLAETATGRSKATENLHRRYGQAKSPGTAAMKASPEKVHEKVEGYDAADAKPDAETPHLPKVRAEAEGRRRK